MENARIIIEEGFQGIQLTEAPEGFVAVRLEPGMKHVVDFINKRIYVMVTETPIRVFAGNSYFGAIVIEIEDGKIKMADTYYIRGRIAIINGLISESRLNVAGVFSDMFKERIAEDVDALRDHFQAEYYQLWKEKPEDWCEYFKETKRILKPLKISYNQNQKLPVFTNK